MATQRILPAVQALSRTIVYNRSDLLHQTTRVYNNHGAQVAYPTLSGHSSHFPNFEEKLHFSHHLLHKGRGSYLKVMTKSFSTGVQYFCREFTDGENEHAHDILCSLPAYKSTTVDTTTNSQNLICTSAFPSLLKEKSWSSLATGELIDTFLFTSKQSSHDLALGDRCYHHLCVSLVERIPYMNDDQLQVVLSALSFWSPPHNGSDSMNFNLLWKALDESCSRRIKAWSISKIFLVADHWYALRISKSSIFFRDFLNHLGYHLKELTPSQFVQYMFYVNLNRELGLVKMKLLEFKILDALKYVSIEEFGIIAMALFKSGTNIRSNELLNMIIKTTQSSLEYISDHSLGSILKLLRISLPGSYHPQCYDFLEHLNSHIDKFSSLALLQAALLGNNLLVFHKGLMCKVGARFANEIPILRLKDIERFIYTLMLYKFIPPDHPNILNQIIKELRKPERIVEINHFPKCFVSCVNYLVAMGAFPHDLISAALQPSMVQLLKSVSWVYIGREINELNWNVKIELPNYIGYTLTPAESDQLTKEFIGRIPPANRGLLNHQERLLVDVQTKMSAMMRLENCVVPTIILPHFSNPDLVFCTTPTGEPVTLPLEFHHLPTHVPKTPAAFSHLGLAWNAVIIGGRNSFIRDTDNELRGNFEVKKRQLAKLGYSVCVVSHRSYSKTSMKFKLQHLEQCLKDSSLNLDGRRQMAFDIIRSNIENAQSLANNIGSTRDDDATPSLARRQ